MTTQNHPEGPFVAVELAGAGAHPAAWRRSDSRAEELFDASYWVDVATAVDAAGADVLFVPDSFAVSTDARAQRGQLDAVALAARVATSTSAVGVIATVTVTHTEPFHVSKAVASLDFATDGRAGWQLDVSPSADDAALFGRSVQDTASLWREAGDAATVVERLWDSWEDDAEIRDESTNRFIDRDKLHYIDFEGEFFSVKGPSITPRPPQGHPVIAVAVDSAESLSVAAAHADVVRIRAAGTADAAVVTARVRRAVVAAGRDPATVRILLDVDALIDGDADAALAQLDSWSERPFVSDTVRYHGDAAGLTDLLATIDSAVADGVTVRPLTLSTLAHLPHLRPDRDADTLRGRLGLERPVNQYAVL